VVDPPTKAISSLLGEMLNVVYPHLRAVLACWCVPLVRMLLSGQSGCPDVALGWQGLDLDRPPFCEAGQSSSSWGLPSVRLLRSYQFSLLFGEATGLKGGEL
jgi:hypothetical protein